jgi:hypothetical protein
MLSIYAHATPYEAFRIDMSKRGWPLNKTPLPPDCHAQRYFATPQEREYYVRLGVSVRRGGQISRQRKAHISTLPSRLRGEHVNLTGACTWYTTL